MTHKNVICWSPLTEPPALVYFETTDAKTAETAANFIEQVRVRCPFHIQTILTDNGKEFTDRFASAGERVPTGRHCCSQVCRRHQSLHRLIVPRQPNTNGMVERFNGRLANILQSTYFQTVDEMRATLRHYLKIYNTRYCKVYNTRIVQRHRGHLTPVQRMEQWQRKKPYLFVRIVDNHPDPDKRAGRSSLQVQVVILH